MVKGEQTTSLSTRRWLDERKQSGNWMDISETDQIPNDIDGWHVTFLHAFQVFFSPEINRRRSATQLPDDFFLTAAQMIQLEGGARIVRLNEEVRGIAMVRASRPVLKGERVFVSDLKDLISFDLEDEELDAGHCTILWTGQRWFLTFDLRAGRAKCADMLAAATQFLEVARFSADSGRARPGIDNLFSACELVSKVHLIRHRHSASKAKTHAPVQSAINAWGRLGNISDNFVRLFNRISSTRYPARYDISAHVESPSSSEFHIVKQEIEFLSEYVAR